MLCATGMVCAGAQHRFSFASLSNPPSVCVCCVCRVLCAPQAVPCNAADHIFCRVLGFHAVDVAFAGYTGTPRVLGLD